MIISRNWLEEYLDLSNYDNKKLEEIIYNKIIEIEKSEDFINASNLVIGKVLECENHPNSDHLHVCKVDIKTEVLQIVCGAPNVKKDAYVIVAKIGAILPGDFKIKPSKIRGVESFGMLCSLEELGVEEKYIEDEFKDGIYLLGDDAIIGEDPLEYLGLKDYMFELGLTPNRSDLLSYYGVLYDIAAVTKQKFELEKFEVIESENINPLNINIKTDKCLKYSTRVLDNIKIEESPRWLKSKLIKNGIRPINNIVDVTNYVLLFLGQPLHAFDYDKFNSNNILVRLANKDEKVLTLDNVLRTLNDEDIVICNNEKVVSIAGIMGGYDTMISNDTTKIILESAYFSPSEIRKTSKRLNLRSDSSIRFERKIDPNRIDLALDLACYLIKNLTNANIYKQINTVDYLNKDEKIINHKFSLINETLGTNISNKEILEILDSLNFKYQVKSDDIIITVPTRRVDIETYQDINEEIARIYGYNNIPLTIPYTNQIGKLTKKQALIKNIKETLTGLGLDETISYSLVDKDSLYKYTLEENDYIDIISPLSEKREIMRQSLIGSLLEVLDYNKKRQIKDILIYEISNVYSKEKEDLKLSFVLEGDYSNLLWQGKKNKIDFFLAKGILNQVFSNLGILNDIKYVPYNLNNESYFPQKTACILYKDELIGILGSLNLKMKEYKDTIVMEINLNKILDKNSQVISFKQLNKFPKIERDLAILVDSNILASDLIKTIKEVGKNMLTEIKIFDVFVDPKLGDNKKSIAFNLSFEDYDKTLESNVVDNKINQILKRLNQVYNATLRN